MFRYVYPAVLLCGCFGGEPPGSDSGDEAGDEAYYLDGDDTDAAVLNISSMLCEAQCPRIAVSCFESRDGSNDCEAKVMITDHAACAAKLYEEVKSDLECADDMGPDVLDEVNGCVGSLLAAECPPTRTQEELDSLAAMAERGEAISTRQEPPPSCAAVEAVCPFFQMPAP